MKKPRISRDMLRSMLNINDEIMVPQFSMPEPDPGETEGDASHLSRCALQAAIRGFHLVNPSTKDVANRLRDAADLIDAHEGGRFELPGYEDDASTSKGGVSHLLLEKAINERRAVESESVAVGNWLRDVADLVEIWKPTFPSIASRP